MSSLPKMTMTAAITALRISLLAIFCLSLSTGVQSQERYPTKPIRLIVPFPPGGGPDVIARILGQQLSASWRQQIVIDNRPGAGGVIGSEIAAKSAPDGYTLIMGNTATHANNVGLYKKLPYHPVKDFVPVCLVASTQSILMVHPGVLAKSVKELIAIARAKPGSLSYASAGNGTAAHLSMELLKTLTGINIVHIPYKGNPQALTDLLSGQVQLMFPTFVAALPHVKSGRLRPLAVTGTRRSPALPDVPTLIEAGVPGYESTLWYGVLAPAGTPGKIVKQLNDEIVTALRKPEVQEQLAAQGADPVGSTPEHFLEYMKAEIAKWSKVIRQAGVRVD